LALRAGRAGIRDAASAAALIALSLLFWARVVAGRVPDYRDFSFFFVPLRHAVALALRSGAAPLWNPFFGGGIPLAADPNASAFFPATLLCAASPTSLGIRLGFLVWAVAFPLLSYWGLRRLGLGCLPAAVGAGALSISGPTMALAGLPSSGWAAALVLPLCALLRDSRRGSSVAAGLVLGLIILAGEPAIALIALAGSVLLGMHRPVARYLRRVAAAAAAGALVALPQIVGAASLLPQTARGAGLPVAFGSAYYSVRPLRLLAFPWPGLFGDPNSPSAQGFWGQGFFDAGGAYIASLAVGTVTLALAAAGSRTSLGRRCLLVAGLAAAASFGRHWSGGEYVLSLPGISSLRYPEKWLFLSTIALFGAAAAGLEAVAVDGRARRAARAAAWTLAGISAALLLACRVFSSGLLRVLTAARIVTEAAANAPETVLRPLAADVRATALFALLAALALGSRALRSRLPAALALLLFADLFPRTWNWIPTEEPGAVDRISPAASAVREAGGRLYFDGERQVALDPLRPFFPVLWSVPMAGNNDIDRFSPRRSFFFGLDLSRKTFSDPAKARLLRLADVHVISTIDPAAAAVSGMSPIGKTSEIRTLYRLAESRRWRLLFSTRLVAGEEEARSALAAPDFDPEAVAVVEGGELPATSAGPGRVEPLARRGGVETVVVVSAAPALLLRSETFDPHWRAQIDGRPARVVPADFAFQGVVVPAGRHVVSFRYRDRATVVAMIVSLATLVGCAGVLRRQRGDGKSRPAYPVSST
jgi:hypothetical protein